ncbi:MAG: purine-nucleoside phosphorylase [Flavobacteriales bacterium]|nr:purine-nucleoside phosphorylase [Flavobacteriales bacterium]MCX7767884.1 purine-nucleoside phosphorylase [Flavobacteriales bacterium]MDW8409288.1 purine-nucleoside phosphorylase [Flavobacteriales bacterium]
MKDTGFLNLSALVQALKPFSEQLLKTTEEKFTFAIILGSGLADAASEFEIIQKIPYADIPGFPTTGVKGHRGQLSLIKDANKSGLLFEGRFHYYEGLTMQQVTAPVLLAYLCGVRYLLLTNASGGLNPSFEIGDIMLVEDQINLMGDSPLRGPNDDSLGPRFPDMTEAFSKSLIKKLIRIAKEENLPLHRGVYVGVHGPSFETPAEYRFLRIIGADAVGMSTVPEVIMARYLNLEVSCLCVITDLGVEGRTVQVSHDDVLKESSKKAKLIARLYKRLLHEIF